MTTMHQRGSRSDAIITIVEMLQNQRLVPFPDVIDLLHNIDRELPDLRFADFVHAIHLAYLAHEPEGRA
jgi:hypothetical protein